MDDLGVPLFSETSICDIVTVSPNPGAEAVSETLWSRRWGKLLEGTVKELCWKSWKNPNLFQWIHQFILIESDWKKADCGNTILFSRPGQSLVLGLQLFFTNAMEAQRNHTRPPSCLDWKNPVFVKDRGLSTGIIWEWLVSWFAFFPSSPFFWITQVNILGQASLLLGVAFFITSDPPSLPPDDSGAACEPHAPICWSKCCQHSNGSDKVHNTVRDRVGGSGGDLPTATRTGTTSCWSCW